MAFRFTTLTKDNALAQKVGRALDGQPGTLETMASASEAWNRIFGEKTDLLILDLELPAAEGLGWFRTLRGTDFGGSFPVVLAGPEKSDAQLAEAFELGADDYVLKSCHERELLARLKSVLRRRYETAMLQEGVMQAGPISLDLGRHSCRADGRPVTLNPREFQLLEMLLRKAGRVLSRPYLLETVWGMDARSSTRAVDVCVSRLRRALGPRAGRCIQTVDSYGYRLERPEERVPAGSRR